MKPRWTRIDELTPVEKEQLEKLTKETPGMTIYGNRARSSVMLPLEIAKIIAQRAADDKITVSEVIIQMLEEELKK